VTTFKKINVVRPINPPGLVVKPNAGRTEDDRRENQMVHFIRRLWGRFGVGLTVDQVKDLAVEVGATVNPQNTLSTQPDGKVVMIARLGRHGEYPVVYDTTTKMLVTALDWSMVRGWRRELRKRLERERAAAKEAECPTG
jgi:hypothetical protein